MLAVLPALCFALVFLHCLCRRHSGPAIRSALLSAFVVWGVALAGITEVLSLLHCLTTGTVAASWAILAAAAGAGLLIRRPATIARWRPARPDILALAMVLPVVVIVLGTGVIAATGWPSQWDSMVYHLSRVDHWMQNRNVGFYPTHIVRQLFNPPAAEYAILHLRVLGGDERWSNAPQWISMVGSLIGVTLIAHRMGATPRGQLFSALFAATIPIGILEASGTQNDYVVALWLVCMTEAALSPPSRMQRFQIGASLGLALLSKGTALLFAGPILLIGYSSIATTWSASAKRGAWILLVAMALNVPHWTRNIATFGSPLGPQKPGSGDETSDKLTNDSASPGIVASNVVRNLALHAGTPFRSLNLALEQGIRRGHAWFGLDVHDPRSTRLYDSQFRISGAAADPDKTGNPAHLLLILAVAGHIVVSRRLRRLPGLIWYGLVLACGFLLFCLVLKWQLWHSRLHLPLFVLAAPLVAVAWEGAHRALLSLSVVLSILAARPLLRNRLAPLIGEHTVLDTPRVHQYFQRFSGAAGVKEQDYVAATELLRARGCADVGLLIGWDD